MYNQEHSTKAGPLHSLDINRRERHLFITDAGLDDAREYEFPSGAFVGSVSCGDGCTPLGIAIDP
jgi:hypothetical protein